MMASLTLSRIMIRATKVAISQYPFDPMVFTQLTIVYRTNSLLKKYGACEKVAIGKGATAVVRLAHKWDQSTEKLYAVKVSACQNTGVSTDLLSRSSGNDARTKLKRSTSRSSLPNSASLLRYITPISSKRWIWSRMRIIIGVK